tara:strand:+ start:179 stop:382 length:204 start_codon:yes stop_codon:yes gene_type:complete
MVKLTDYDTLQAYVDATLAMDGPPKKKNKYGEEGQMKTPQKMQEGQTQTPQKMRTMQKPKQNRKKGQ